MAAIHTPEGELTITTCQQTGNPGSKLSLSGELEIRGYLNGGASLRAHESVAGLLGDRPRGPAARRRNLVGILVGKQPQESFSFFVMPGAGALEEIDRQLRADGVSPAGVPQRVGEIAFCVGYATACLRTDLAEDQRRAQQEKILGAARQAGIDLRQNLDIDSDGNLRGIRRSVFAI